MKLENDEVIFQRPIAIQGGIRSMAQRFVAADTTPSVVNHTTWIANNLGAVTVTRFDDGYETQVLRILGDGFTTVANNAFIKTNTGANKLMLANKVYVFTLINTVWYEDA
jgi:hypothetical protein